MYVRVSEYAGLDGWTKHIIARCGYYSIIAAVTLEINERETVVGPFVGTFTCTTHTSASTMVEK
jgi:hypothetical protein